MYYKNLLFFSNFKGSDQGVGGGWGVGREAKRTGRILSFQKQDRVFPLRYPSTTDSQSHSEFWESTEINAKSKLLSTKGKFSRLE